MSNIAARMSKDKEMNSEIGNREITGDTQEFSVEHRGQERMRKEEVQAILNSGQVEITVVIPSYHSSKHSKGHEGTQLLFPTCRLSWISQPLEPRNSLQLCLCPAGSQARSQGPPSQARQPGPTLLDHN